MYEYGKVPQLYTLSPMTFQEFKGLEAEYVLL